MSSRYAWPEWSGRVDRPYLLTSVPVASGGHSNVTVGSCGNDGPGLRSATARIQGGDTTRAIHPWAAFGSALALSLLLVGGEGLVAPPTTEAATSCRVRNVSQGTQGRSLKRMVRRSRDGDRLIMRGTCAGQVVIGTDIVITGKGQRPTISGWGKRRVVAVKPGARVVLRNLRVQRGRTDKGTAGGAGILNDGRLTIIGSRISDNVARRRGGGGILNTQSGRLVVIGSTISGNATRSHGGGINNEGTARITTSTVKGNDSKRGGPAIETSSRGTFTLIDSVVSDNSGAGIDVRCCRGQGAVRLVRTIVSDNSDAGIFVSDGSVTLRKTTVRGNTGGGIWVGGLSRVTLENSTVQGNSTSWKGGGISTYGRLVLRDSTVTANTAAIEGGGIYAHLDSSRAQVTLEGSSSVHDNVPDDCVGTTAC